MKKPAIKILAGVLLVLMAVIGGLAAGIPAYRSWIRHAWKEAAIEDISRRYDDKAAVAREVKELEARVKVDPSAFRSWHSDGVIVMKDGEWLVFSSIAMKQDWRIDDIFLARGSDGKWYYSTFHFCIRQVSLSMFPQPANLAEFREVFWLREFDGRSDECLKKTRPEPKTTKKDHP